MRRNRVRLTESQLHRVIKESVRRVLKESTRKKHWTPETIRQFVEDNDGDALNLLYDFPYSPINKQKIDAAYRDEDNFTDSDFCDYLIDLAIEQVTNHR